LALGLTKTGLGRLARPFLERAIALDPSDASCHVELGNLLQALGDTEQALASFRRASALRPVTTWKGPRSDFAALLIMSPGAGNTPPHFLFGDANYDRNFITLLPGIAQDIERLRAHADIVINLISDLDQAGPILPGAAELIDAIARPVINHPSRILTTGREQIARTLSRIGDCRTPKAIRCSREGLVSGEALAWLQQEGASSPLLVRLAGTHGGDAFEKIDGAEDIASFLAQNAGEEFYVSEYVDYQSADGYFRKYRFVFANEEILPYHLAIADQWKVHHFRTDMAHHVWMQDEEKRFLEDPMRVFCGPRWRALEDVRAAIALDFFGIDCSLDRGGQVVVFEVNASMLVHGDNKEFPYKNPHCVRIKQAFDAMLTRRVADAVKSAQERRSPRQNSAA
jgi:tetratricopeptide (TPR) repeat protein